MLVLEYNYWLDIMLLVIGGCFVLLSFLEMQARYKPPTIMKQDFDKEDKRDWSNPEEPDGD